MKFKTILADPPWPYTSPRAIIGNGGRGVSIISTKIQIDVTQHYPVMSLKNITSMNVESISENNAHLYLWTTNGFMEEAHRVANAWGFKVKTIITWVKIKNGSLNVPSMRAGYWYRGATEHILFCVKGKLKLNGPCHPTAFLTTRLGHSIKPEYSYKMIESHSPPNYLELFARKKRDGWSAYGNEIKSDIII